MRKQFPAPKGLRSKSFASRYAGLRKFASRRPKTERKDSRLIVSTNPLAVPKRSSSFSPHAKIPFSLALLIAFGVFGTFLTWLHFLK